MENNNFGEIVKVMWESLVNASSSIAYGLISWEGAGLVVLGIACIIATRRYLPTLAAERTLQPAAAVELQRALRPTAVPLSAPMHTAAEAGGGDTTSHAA